MLTIREAIETVILLEMSKVIVKSDSRLIVNSILSINQTPKRIRNLTEDISYLVNDLREIEFIHYTGNS